MIRALFIIHCLIPVLFIGGCASMFGGAIAAEALVVLPIVANLVFILLACMRGQGPGYALAASGAIYAAAFAILFYSQGGGTGGFFALLVLLLFLKVAFAIGFGLAMVSDANRRTAYDDKTPPGYDPDQDERLR